MSRRLFVYLHGHGSSPAEVSDDLTAMDPERRYIAVTPEGPLAITSAGRAWFDSDARGADEASIRRAVEWVSEVLRGCTTDLGIDMADVVLGGFSQGAATALAVAASCDDSLGGLLLQAPFIPEGPSFELDLRSVPRTAVLIQRGIADEMIPAFQVDHIAAELTAGGCSVDHETSPGAHERSTEMLSHAADWLRRRFGE